MRVSAAQIRGAQKRISKLVRKTPLEYSPFFSKAVKGKVYLKLENQQLTGSFKIRGASNMMLRHVAKEKTRGVLAVSTGNHAQGVGLAATLLKIKTIIIVPKSASKTKVEAIRKYKVDLKILGKDFEDAQDKAAEILKKKKMVFVSPYNDPEIIAGQGTIGLEIMKQKHKINIIVVPVGGGGLISGIAIAAKSINPRIKVIGVQTVASPIMYESLKAGKIVDVKVKHSIADGIKGCLDHETITFDLIKKYVDKIVLVNEDEIKNAIRIFLEQHHQVVEGAGAVGLAAVLKYRKMFKGKRTAVVISGGNIDVELLRKIIRT